MSAKATKEKMPDRCSTRYPQRSCTAIDGCTERIRREVCTIGREKAQNGGSTARTVKDNEKGRPGVSTTNDNQCKLPPTFFF